MNKRQKKALKESVVTVFTGMLINWPVSIVFLYLFIDIMKLQFHAHTFLVETHLHIMLSYLFRFGPDWGR